MKFKSIYTLATAVLATHFSIGQTYCRLDSTFGQGGISITHFGNDYLKVGYGLQQSDGKLLMFGSRYWSNGNSYHTLISRHNLSGALDSTFGINGFVVDSINQIYNESISEAALQDDQKMVLAGWVTDISHNYNKWLVCRYLPSGVRDSSFGNNGSVITDMGVSSQARTVVVQPDNRIVVLGYGGELRRYNTDGSVDSSFNNGNIWVPDDKFQTSLLLLQPDGKIIMGGTTIDTTNATTWTTFRFLPDGQPDSTFGVNGKARHGVGSNIGNGTVITHQANRLALDDAGRIVMVGTVYNPFKNNFNVLVMRITQNGSLDANFNHRTISLNSNNYDQAAGVLTEADGTIIVGATSGLNTNYVDAHVVLIGLDSNGNDNPLFGQNGKIETEVQNGAWISNMFHQADGKIVVCGDNYYQGNSNALMIRYEKGTHPIPSSISSTEGIQSTISIYPNPTNNQLFIDMSHTQIKTDCRFELNDITGKVMVSGTLKTGVNSISISSLANGLYLLQITNGSERMVSKVVKE